MADNAKCYWKTKWNKLWAVTVAWRAKVFREFDNRGSFGVVGRASDPCELRMGREMEQSF